MLYSKEKVDVGISHLRKSDRKLAKIIREAKLKPNRIFTKRKPLAALYTAILNQQISGAAANTIQKRFYSIYGGKAPSHKQLLSTNARKLRACGLSRQKIAYLKDLAKKVSKNTVQIHKLGHLSDEEVKRELTSVKGIGTWTAEMFLMFNLGRMDVFPVGDLGIRNGMKKLYGLEDKAPLTKYVEIAESWRPYRSIGSWYIWHINDK